jgi:hypothetical protein
VIGLRNVALHGAIAYRCTTDAFELARNAYHMYQRSDRGEINILGGKTAIVYLNEFKDKTLNQPEALLE